MFTVQISPWVQQTLNKLPPGIGSLFFQSHLLRENAAPFLQLKPFTRYQLSFHLVPITAGWTKLIKGFYTSLALRESISNLQISGPPH